MRQSLYISVQISLPISRQFYARRSIGLGASAEIIAALAPVRDGRGADRAMIGATGRIARRSKD